MPATPIVYQPYQVAGAHQSLTVATLTSVPLPSGANGLIIQAVTQNVRITLDGSSPSATRGFQIKAGDAPVLLLMQPNSPTLLAIQEVAGAILEVQGVIQAFA